MSYRIIFLPGDGVGREVTREGRKVLEAVSDHYGISFHCESYSCGGQYYLETGKECADEAFEDCKKADAVVLGAIGWPGATLPDGNLAGAGVVFGLRFGLDLYANVRPTKLYPGVRHRICNEFRQVWKPESVDFVIVRENTEGCYTPTRGFLKRGGITELAVDSRIITRKGCERVIRFAFKLCMNRKGAPKDGKRRVTCVDKSNVMNGCQLFRQVYDEIAPTYPVERDYSYIDAFTQWIIRNPEFYDVAVTSNMLGDIATDLASVLQGGMGMAASANIGDSHAMFEPVHGSAPKYAGQDKANPIASILSVQMMLSYLGEKKSDDRAKEAAGAVEKAVGSVLQRGKPLTYDLGGEARCSQVGDAVVEAIKQS
ncbi:MAG: isocitrate/isopropylmalate dehydrogenase family protein [Theionarchaea archaeon]|nr:isocitrate/isopropylmalate dehydrogenase family protein [Theionarchaea archaeon]MBU7036998.1 isocitrate/isopropylmalate dehydrogenase family protein [Theionarchaea archaeon]